MDHDYMLRTAKELACVDLRSGVPADFYVVWFAKVLGNWKALVSTDVVDEHYWEITFNGAKNEAYVDRYVKASNTVVSFESV